MRGRRGHSSRRGVWTSRRLWDEGLGIGIGVDSPGTCALVRGCMRTLMMIVGDGSGKSCIYKMHLHKIGIDSIGVAYQSMLRLTLCRQRQY